VLQRGFAALRASLTDGAVLLDIPTRTYSEVVRATANRLGVGGPRAWTRACVNAQSIFCCLSAFNIHGSDYLPWWRPRFGLRIDGCGALVA
jgi:hypothetical protein